MSRLPLPTVDEPAQGIRILIADDHMLMREGLGTLIAQQPNMTVVAEAEDGLSAVRLAAELSPDVILMDVSMPVLNGIDATRRILATGAASKVIALSMHLGKNMVLNMLDAGVAGYILKDSAFDELIHAIGTVATGRTYLGQKIIDMVVKDYNKRQDKNALRLKMDHIPVEHKMMQHLFEGRGLNDIASMLGISITETEHLRQTIIHKHIAPWLKRTSDQDADNETGCDRCLYLTGREKEILLFLKDGQSVADMSLNMSISEATVKFHIQNIYRKFKTNSRAKAVMIAVENKLIPT